MNSRLFFVFLNSFYSFYWDVAKDWDLSLFSSRSERNDPEHPYGLRRHRYFQRVQLYYAAIFTDFLLRCTWSFKLSPHLDHFNDLEGGIFLMELLEVFRRWMWIFFRVETESGLLPLILPSLFLLTLLQFGITGALLLTISYSASLVVK
jgi:hypothetical protein